VASHSAFLLTIFNGVFCTLNLAPTLAPTPTLTLTSTPTLTLTLTLTLAPTYPYLSPQPAVFRTESEDARRWFGTGEMRTVLLSWGDK
jgi:hypothetical protein